MKAKLIFLVVLLSSITLVMAAAPQAKVTFTVPTAVVYDVPLGVNVNLDTHGAQFIDYDIVVTTDTQKALFNSHSGGAFTNELSLTGVKEGGISYRYYTNTDGTTLVKTGDTLFTLTGVKFTPASIGDTRFTLQSGKVTPPTGEAFEVTSEASMVVKPQLSVCGDGVVGYEDINRNGVKDAEDNPEACDEGVNQGKGGCADDCTYVTLGYIGNNCGFGSYSCMVTALSAREFFLQKITALINGECYPNNVHPERMYCDDTGVGRTSSVDGITISGNQQVYMIAQMATALNDLFTGIVQ